VRLFYEKEKDKVKQRKGHCRVLTFHNSSLLAVSRLLLLCGRLLPTDGDMPNNLLKCVDTPEWFRIDTPAAGICLRLPA
jgi:hypothetical protein